MKNTGLLAAVLVAIGLGSLFAALAFTTYNASYYNNQGWQQQLRSQTTGQLNPPSLPPPSSGGNQITLDQAKLTAKQYLDSLRNPNLAIKEIMEFQYNFYIIYYEKDTGRGAFEMLIWKQVPPSGMMGSGMGMYGVRIGAIMPEPGPNMMWNAKYSQMGNGMMGGGMMGNWDQAAAGTMTVTEARALEIAQTYLSSNLSGAKVEDEATQFYGYYTMDFTINGKVAGMLSVNGQTGQVWYHTWHGAFIQEVEFD